MGIFNRSKDEDTGANVKIEESTAFAPGLIGLQESPPSPLPRLVLRGVLVLLILMFLWAMFGKLDVVSVAEGKLVPVSYLKIVQPAEAGIVREIAVREGQQVEAGQILVKMDANIAEADSKTIQQELQHQKLQLRRIEAELSGLPFKQEDDDPVDMFVKVNASYASNRRAYESDLAAERANRQKAHSDLAATVEVQHKLEKTLPSYQKEAAAYQELVADGYAGELMAQEKQRNHIEAEQDLRAQRYNANSLRASIAQSNKRLAQIESAYRQKLEAERVDTFAQVQKLEQDWARQDHRNSLLELKAPQAGTIKDLATHTPGTVVSPGTVLMSLVPHNEALHAEVWLKNADAGFVRKGQEVKLKLMAYPFQKYGMIDGVVAQVSADATEKQGQQQSRADTSEAPETAQSSYRTIIDLSNQHLLFDGAELDVTAGMQVVAEIKLLDQTVMQYLLSPVRKAFHEAARER